MVSKRHYHNLVLHLWYRSSAWSGYPFTCHCCFIDGWYYYQPILTEGETFDVLLVIGSQVKITSVLRPISIPLLLFWLLVSEIQHSCFLKLCCLPDCKRMCNSLRFCMFIKAIIYIPVRAKFSSPTCEAKACNGDNLD